MAKSSLYYFTKYVLGYDELCLQPHWAMCRFIQDHFFTNDTLLQVPRATFKSTVFSISATLWAIATYDRNLRILLNSAEDDNSKGFLGSIVWHIEKNPEFRLLFGDLKGDPRRESRSWTTTDIVVTGRTTAKVEATITATSVRKSEVSQHYDIIICDDLMNEKTSSTPESIRKVWAHYELLAPIIDRSHLTGRRGPIHTVGTSWGFADTHERLKQLVKAEKKRYGYSNIRVFHASAAEKYHLREGRWVFEGKLFFPGRVDQAYLNDLQDRGMSVDNIACQYLNDPMPPGTQTFRLEDFGFFNSTEYRLPGWVRAKPLPKMTNYAAVDPAISEDERNDNCNSAIVTVGASERMDLFIKSCWAQQVGPDDLIQGMYEEYVKYKVSRMGIESILFQALLVPILKKYGLHRGRHLNVQKLKAGNTRAAKQLRITSLQPLQRAGKLFLRVKDDVSINEDPKTLYYHLVPGVDMLADEMLHYPKGGTIDRVDALSFIPMMVGHFTEEDVDEMAQEDSVFGEGPETFGQLKRRMRNASAPGSGGISFHPVIPPS